MVGNELELNIINRFQTPFKPTVCRAHICICFPLKTIISYASHAQVSYSSQLSSALGAQATTKIVP